MHEWKKPEGINCREQLQSFPLQHKSAKTATAATQFLPYDTHPIIPNVGHISHSPQTFPQLPSQTGTVTENPNVVQGHGLNRYMCTRVHAHAHTHNLSSQKVKTHFS